MSHRLQQLNNVNEYQNTALIPFTAVCTAVARNLFKTCDPSILVMASVWTLNVTKEFSFSDRNEQKV